MRSSDTLTKISPAMVKAINAIEGVKKGADNPFFKSKYANLESVIEAAHDALSANGLAVMQGPGPMDGNCITLTTRLIHESGEWIETDFSLPAGKMDPQAAGSAITYARRYSLMAMLNMPAVDDDGEASMPHSQPQTKVTQDQADTLEALIQDVGADRGRFLDYFKVSDPKLILASDYNRAVDALEAKRGK